MKCIYVAHNTMLVGSCTDGLYARRRTPEQLSFWQKRTDIFILPDNSILLTCTCAPLSTSPRKCMENWRYRSTHFTLGIRWTEVSGQLHAPSSLFQGKDHPLPIRRTGVCAGPKNVKHTFVNRKFYQGVNQNFHIWRKLQHCRWKQLFFSFPNVNTVYFSVGRGREGEDDLINTF